MRPQFLVLWLFLAAAPMKSISQKLSSYYNGKKVSYKIASDKFLIAFSEENFNKNMRLKSLISRTENLGYLNAHLVTLNKSHDEGKILRLIGELVEGDEMITYASPILLNENGEEIGGLTNQFMVRLKPTTSIEEFNLLTRAVNAKISSYQFDSRTYFIITNGKSSIDALQLANEFYESGLFEFAEPDFLFFVYKATNDDFFNQQWAINNTGQSGGTAGADMKVLKAWEITTGCNAVRIAILDDGVELNHPDLNDNLDPGFDATGGGSNGGPGGNDSHGTSCAGIAGAEGDNSVGVAGVAYNCRLVPVRVMTGESTTFDLATAGWMAAGIDWAWQNNRADVLSMSWRISVGQAGIDQAINRAVTQGRDGLGCVILVASGNDNSETITYPASNLQVIAVGASTPCDTRKNTSSCDGENWWGSNFGTGLDIVAPGVKVYSTDRQGTIGFNTSEGEAGNYVSNFNGTSSATPNAAGVVALILSANPTLTEIQARQILESTTDKLSSYTFNANVAGQPNGTWNNEVGYGRVNAERAVTAAVGGPVVGPDLICSSGVYHLQNPTQGVVVTWSTSNPNGLNIDNTGTVTRLNNFNGQVTITATVNSGCASVSRNVWVGDPSIVYYPPGYNPCTDNPWYAGPIIQGVSYSWSVDNPNVWFTTNTTHYSAAVISYNPEYFNITLTVSEGSCSTSTTLFSYTDGYYCQCFFDPACGGLSLFTATPNPAGQQIDVGIEDGEYEKELKKIGRISYALALIDDKGNVHSNVEVIGKSYRWDTSKISDGTYYLKIIYKDLIETRRIIIKH